MNPALLLEGYSSHLTLTLGSAAASSSDSLIWYFTRTAAVSAYVVLTLLVALGLVRSFARISGERISWIVDEIHQWLGTVFGALVMLHIVALVLDPFLPFTWLNLLVPTNEPYRPLAVALGVLAFWTMVLVLGSSWIRRHLPHRFWRAFHYLSFATFVLVTVHGILSGSDTGESWMLGLYIGAGVIVGFLTVLRMLPRSLLGSDPAPQR